MRAPDQRLDQLAGCKGRFDAASARRAEALLQQLERTPLRDEAELIRLHETALFLRGYPHNARVAELSDRLLSGFAERLRGAALDAFDDPEISGISGTVVSTNFSHEFASSLADRHPQCVEIDWAEFVNPGRLGVVLGRLIPAAYEDYAVAPHADWRGWMERSRRDLRWLLARVDPATYELLEIPVRWSVCSLGRSTLRLQAADLFYHSGPLLRRSDVSLEAEFASNPIPLRKLRRDEARNALGLIVDASAARYRELYGFQYPDSSAIYRAGLGRGVELFYFGVHPDRRLPARDYRCGMFFKNGVPAGYVETLSRGRDCEVGFNLYYTFREGETAWLYARILKLLHDRLSVTRFFIDPYQLGHENDEAISSGAFWFYYKLGFRPAAAEAQKLAETEARKIAGKPGYRSSPAVLRRLAGVPLQYRVP